MERFHLGCNYWASHAGIEMWKNWDEAQVERDFAILEANGVKTMRVFPLWRDFQPVMPVYGPRGFLREYMLEGCVEPTNPYYLDPVMMERFGIFCDIAKRHGMSFIVGLLTGWMSDRLFIPTALNDRNLFTDPFALSLEMKFVRGFVEAFRDRDVIYAWDLGNECNQMSRNYGRDAAYSWSAIIANTIRAYDNTRPVISGMHGLTVEDSDWTISDQGETTDILTTHPYAYFVPYCLNDPIDSFRTLLHGTCESALYSSISGKPCMVEELGTLGRNMCHDDISGNFMKANLYSNWANGATGVLWWCAHEQAELTTPPYYWNMLERELGMLYLDMTPKPYLTELKKFGEWLDTLDFEIEQPKKDALVVLTKDQDHWGMAYMSYLLGKQAGVTLDFLAPNKDIPESDVYIMPSITGCHVLYTKYYEQLKARVRDGATLYISNNDAFLSQFEEVTGCSILEKEQAYRGGEFDLDGYKIPYNFSQRVKLVPNTAEVLATDNEGNPILVVNKFGKGKIYYLNFPLERMLTGMNRAFDSDTYRLYEKILEPVLKDKKVRKTHPKVGVTENGKIVTLVNYSNEAVDPGLVLNGVEIDKIYRGSVNKIDACDALVFSVK